jgi:hypothetical protein
VHPVEFGLSQRSDVVVSINRLVNVKAAIIDLFKEIKRSAVLDDATA